MKKGTKRIGFLLLLTGAFTALWAGIQKAVFFFATQKKPSIHPYQTFVGKELSAAYRVYGTGKPLVLLHNTEVGASQVEWEQNIGALSRTYQVYTLDLPGFGLSPVQKITYTAYQYALFLLEFLQQEVGRPAVLFGSSASCGLALAAARLEPQWVRGLVLVSPTGVYEPFAKTKELWLRRMLMSPLLGTGRYLAYANRRAVEEHLRSVAFFDWQRIPSAWTEVYTYFAHANGANARFPFASEQTGCLGTPVLTAIESLHIPLLVIWGEENTQNPPALEVLLSRYPAGEYLLFEKTRLLPHAENPTRFDRAVLDFLEKVDVSS